MSTNPSRNCLAWAPFSLAAVLLLAVGFSTSVFAQSKTEISGKVIQIDDEHFADCYHNAFEGTILQPSEGKYKSGPQEIRRTKAVLTGAGTADRAMTLTFDLPAAPGGDVQLAIRGIDDRFEPQSTIHVSVNDKLLANDIVFPNNRSVKEGMNQRYFLGWEDRNVTIPATALKAGRNVLRIENTVEVFASPTWRYILVDFVTLTFPGETKMTVHSPPTPLYYYGLNEGVETHLWPTINYDNKLCLLTNSGLEHNFFFTLPKEKPLGKGESFAKTGARTEREFNLHVLTDTQIEIVNIKGEPLKVEKTEEGYHYTEPIDRFVKFETPHPAQGIRVFMRGIKPVEGKMLKAWYSVDGVDYRKSEYPLRVVTLEPVQNRDQVNFQLSLWGSSPPKDEGGLAEYISLLKGAGFNHQFTGPDDELNAHLQSEGFQVYPRYGWFGHQFKVDEETAKFAAIDQKGEAETRDYCPLAILANPEHEKLGRFFGIAKKYGQLPNIDGICVDYETGAVWCWCENCLSEFTQVTGIKIDGRDEVASDGKYANEYRDFGRSLNRRILTKVKEIMLEQNPKLKYHCLSSAADLPTYWYDGRVNARHAVKELVKFADAVYGSHYCYETPSGLGSVIPVVQTVKRLAVESGREVGTYLITPVATTVSEAPRYRGVFLRPEMTRLMALLIAGSGGEGLALFRGDCMDGNQYVSCRQAIVDMLEIKDYIKGIDRSFEASITPADVNRPLYDTELSQNLMSRFVWRPDFSYQYDVIHLMKNKMGHDRLVMVFNYSETPVDFNVKLKGLYDPNYKLSNLKTGESLGDFNRIEIESGKPRVTVPARDVLFVRVQTVE